MKFLVIGDSCIDIFIYGKVHRLSPEAPIPIFTPTREVKNEGMGGNVFNNLSSLIDKYNPSFVVDSILSSNNVTKTRYVDDASNHYFIRVDSGENHDKLNLQEKRIEGLIGEADCIIISDYDKGFISFSDIQNICKGKKKNAVVFLDTKKKVYEDTLYFVDFIKFNKVEFESHNHILKDLGGFNQKIIVTMGGDGVEYNGRVFKGEKVVTMDVSGAGDTFLSALALNYLTSKDIVMAIEFANQIAGEVVRKRGVASI